MSEVRYGSTQTWCALLAAQLSRSIASRATAENRDDARRQIKALEALLPSGAGIDSGIKIDSESHADQIVLRLSFHHLNDHGYYDGWTDHVVRITPAFDGVNLRVGGRDRNQVKEYLEETLYRAVTAHYRSRYEADANGTFAFRRFEEAP